MSRGFCIFARDSYNHLYEELARTVAMLYEILETPDGDIVLRRIEGDAEPLVRIRFSEPARAHLGGAGLLVAKAMVEAGIKAFNELHQETTSADSSAQPRQLH